MCFGNWREEEEAKLLSFPKSEKEPKSSTKKKHPVPVKAEVKAPVKRKKLELK